MYVPGTTAGLLLQLGPVMLPWPVRKPKGVEALFATMEASVLALGF